MHVFIFGMGHVGKALATKLRAEGHCVTGSTTTPDKVDDLTQYADHIVVLRGAESEKLRTVAEGCDVIVATAAPNVNNTRTVEERHQHYADVLVASCRSARKACDRVVFLSSFSVYGDGSGAIIGLFGVNGAAGILIGTAGGGWLFANIRPSAPFVLFGLLNGLVFIWSLWVKR